MNLKSFDELLKLLKEQSEKQNELIKKQNFEFYMNLFKNSDVNHISRNAFFYEAVLEFLELDFECYKIDFKNSVVNFFNTHYRELFIDADLKDFFLIRDIFYMNSALRYSYYEAKLPFGAKDKDKFDKKLKTFEKKKKLFYSIPAEFIDVSSPYDCLKNFQRRAKDRLIRINTNNSIIHNYKFKRDKEQFENELIFELIEIITNDNYFKDIKNKSNFRVTPKTTAISINRENNYTNSILNGEKIFQFSLKKKG